jgi:exodeoxyribonuclease V alpha subunit
VEFDDRTIDYEFAEMDQLVHAYTISIHKSQRSEFQVEVTPNLKQHYLMLQRTMQYKAITRARKLVVLVGSRQAIGIAVNNNRITERNTRLRQRLVSYVAPPAAQGLYTA